MHCSNTAIVKISRRGNSAKYAAVLVLLELLFLLRVAPREDGLDPGPRDDGRDPAPRDGGREFGRELLRDTGREEDLDPGLDPVLDFGRVVFDLETGREEEEEEEEERRMRLGPNNLSSTG